MSPVLQGVDLTSVSTEREAYPEGEYMVTIKETELQENNKGLIVKCRIDEPAEFQNREFWDFINLVQNDGKQNRIGHETIKRYIEAAYGKGSPEAESNPPDTDVLNGQRVRLVLGSKEYKPKDWKEGDALVKGNKVKTVLPA